MTFSSKFSVAITSLLQYYNAAPAVLHPELMKEYLSSCIESGSLILERIKQDYRLLASKDIYKDILITPMSSAVTSKDSKNSTITAFEKKHKEKERFANMLSVFLFLFGMSVRTTDFFPSMV